MGFNRLAAMSVAVLVGIGTWAPLTKAQEQPAPPARAAAKPPAKDAKARPQPVHRIAIQVAANDPALMGLALNNAANFIAHYKDKGEKAVVEIVTFGPGLHMLRDDTSPVKQRIAAMALQSPEITFAACGNTQANMARQEGKDVKDVKLVSEARLTPSGVVRLAELQRQGYSYIRP